MALYDAIVSDDWDEANRLLDDPNYNVNKPVNYPPLEACARYARDSKNKRGDYVEDENVRIMRRILQHPTFKRDPENDPCSKALFMVCDELKSVIAAKLLLKQENINLGMKLITDDVPMLHSMMRRLRSSNIDKATHILIGLLRYPQIGDFINKHDYGLSALASFLCNTNIHCYDLEITVKPIRIIEML